MTLATMQHICAKRGFNRHQDFCPACEGTTEERARETRQLIAEREENQRQARQLVEQLPDLMKQCIQAMRDERYLDLAMSLRAIQDDARAVTTHWSWA